VGSWQSRNAVLQLCVTVPKLSYYYYSADPEHVADGIGTQAEAPPTCLLSSLPADLPPSIPLSLSF
jgi:hypothetical protein